MSHNRKLGKPTDQRIAMLRAMTTYLLENGQIKTTVSRAKEVAPMDHPGQERQSGQLPQGPVLPDQGGCGQEAV